MGKPRDLANVVATGNILADGAVAPAELTGVTSTAAEINILDGVTATAAELNLLDGVTATTAELNHVDGVTSNVQTQMDTKAPVADPTFTGTATAPTVNASTALQIGGVAVTATAAELNKMDGVTVSASDINSVTTKLPLSGGTLTGTTTITTADNSAQLNLTSTDTDANNGPRLVLQRDSSSPADNDVLGQIEWYGENDASEAIEQAKITAIAIDVTDGSEDAALNISTKINSSTKSRIYMPPTETVFNEESVDVDFRVESDGNTHALFVEGSSGHLYIGKSSSSSAVAGTFIQSTGGIDATRDGNRVFVANRLSSDGEIINLQKDNSTVGSIAADNLNITISAYGEEYQSLSGTSVTIDCRAGNNFALATSGNTTFTFSNATSSGTAFGFTLKLTSGGSHTITYPNSVDFAGGTAPDAPASGETDILVFYTVDGGTNWYGALAIDAAG